MYLLDADTFITPSRHHYSFDIAPGFWDWLASATTRQHIASVESVRDEITAGHGDLYRQAAQSEFLDKADYHLIAQARSGNHTVVTLEQSAPLSQRRVKIPDACLAMGVQCINPYELYRRLGLRLRT